MMNLRLIVLPVSTLLLAATLACSSDDEPADGDIVPVPEQATAVSGDAESSVVLLGSRAFQFFPTTCDLSGSRFEVAGQGQQAGQPFELELSGDAATNSVDLMLDIGANVGSATPVTDAENLRESWTSTGEASTVEVSSDDSTIDVVTPVEETSPPVNQDETVEARVTIQCA